MLHTFAKGGIHPKENKLSQSQKIESVGIPEYVSISLTQHIGVPAIPKVLVGDSVKAGTCIGESGGYISARVHSSVSGVVTKIDSVVDVSGFKRVAVIIKVEGDEWDESIETSNELKKEIIGTPEELKQKIADFGIVGMGGATFPLHVKLNPLAGEKPHSLIINAAECEPYLTADHRLLLEKAEEICVGIQIIKKIIDVEIAYIGIENNKKDAIVLLQKVVKDYPGIKVIPLHVKYPQGGEKQLIQAILSKEVPSGKLPISVGTIVVNVATAFATYEAIQKNKPLIDRVITVTGVAIEKPSNFLVRIGTSAEFLLNAAGGVPESTEKIIAGGPMMGKAIVNTNVAVTKGTSGIVVFPNVKSHRKEAQNCIRCARCVHVCPMGIEPYLLQLYSEKSMFEELEDHHVLDCVECGSCSYICPSSRPLLDYIRLGKSSVSQIIRKRNQK